MEDALSFDVSNVELIQDTISRYRATFGAEPDLVATAPGRVNLIGEHTDYNGGFVMPSAIDRRVIIAAGNRPDQVLALSAVNLGSSTQVSLARPAPEKKASWANYSIGVASILQKKGYALSGANFCIRGTVPMGAGLSSSAALEVASATAFRQLNGLQISPSELIQIARAAEVEFVGVECGIMDQFASVMGRKGHALFLDCRSLEFSHIGCPQGASLVICDTGLRRELAGSAYNARRSECQAALSGLSLSLGTLASLRDVPIDEFQKASGSLPVILRKRAWHVISENDRVLKAVRALQVGDLPGLGKLMLESHQSLRDEYEVSCPELDTFVQIASQTRGVYGARMTGAGFGGCAICIAADGAVDELVDRLNAEYPERTGRPLTIYLASADDGASLIFPRESLIAIGVDQLQ